MSDLFEASAVDEFAPLAERMRPGTLDEFIGQEHLIGPGKILRRMVDRGALTSMILWGPPGTGKTTLALLLAGAADARFVKFSAVLSGVKEIREIVHQAKENRKYDHRRTILFVDEIHRFNKAQQDAFLPHVESGLITLIGATTENPSFEVIAALLSRTRVLVLHRLEEQDLEKLLDRALTDPDQGLGKLKVRLEPEARDFLIRAADGDGRALLVGLELAATVAGAEAGGGKAVGLADVEEAVQKRALKYDKSGEEHFNLISALHKSLRDSDPDAALYWLARMLEAGEDPVYILRRMIRFASEDVGLADPLGLLLGTSALDAYRLLGSPEGDLALAHLAVHLACAEKSNALYAGFGRARKDAREKGSLPVPPHIRNAPTRLMKELGYGRGYQYAHDHQDALVDQEHLPDELAGARYFTPTDRGREKALAQWLERRRRRLAGEDE